MGILVRCRLDLPGWQTLYDELKGKNFEDHRRRAGHRGEAAAGKWYDAAKATFTRWSIPRMRSVPHFNSRTCPTGVWIDERGRVVRPGEPSVDHQPHPDVRRQASRHWGAEYVAGIRDWVPTESDSTYALSDADFAARVKPRSPNEMDADASFALAVWFHHLGNRAREEYFEHAQALNPDDWNYHRQDWSLRRKPARSGWTSSRSWRSRLTHAQLKPKTDKPKG